MKLLVLLGILSCVLSSSASAEDRMMKFGVSPSANSLIAMLGQPQYLNYFSTEGLDVRFENIERPDVPKSLHEGRIDVALGDLSSVIANHDKYPELIYWYGLITYDNGFALLIRPGGSLKSVTQMDNGRGTREDAVKAAIRQLKGKTIVARAGGSGDLAVSLLAQHAGLHVSNDASSDIHIINYGTEEGEKAFLAGTGDAYIGPVLQRTEAEKAGMVEMVGGKDLGAAPLLGFVTTKSYAARHPGELVDLLHGWFRIANYVDAHRTQAGAWIGDLLAERTSGTMSVADFLNDWQGYEHFALSPAQAAKSMLDPDGPDYWQVRQNECNQFYCSIAETLPEPVSAVEVFKMPEAQDAYVAKYGEGAR